MSKPQKPEESKLDKFKKFLGFGGVAGNFQVGNVRPPQKQFILTADQVKEISPSSPHNNRISTIRHFCDIVLNRRLEENAVEVFWVNIKDLLQETAPTDDRRLALHFLTCLIRGQYDQLDIMRAQFFRVVKDHRNPEDLPQRLEMFQVLSSDGKDLKHFEEETGELLLLWMKDVISTQYMNSYMKLLINVIKFNAAYLDEDVVAGLIMNTCVIATRTGSEDDIELCLDLLDKFLCYYYLPSETLPQFIDCMCRIINIQKYCQTSWKLMCKLLGTHLGHSGIYTMCCILQDKNNMNENGAGLLRGAVFFIGMALWGSKKIASLRHPPSTVLPSFLQALENSEASLVAYEIVLSLHRLVSKYGREQQIVTWDLILSLMEELLDHLDTHNSMGAELVSKVHDLLSAVEELHKQKQLNGDTDRLFTIIESCASKRPETSILALISHKAQSIHPGRDAWLTNLNHLVEKYFIHEVRTKIREKVLEILSTTLNRNKYLYEDELIDGVVLTQLSHIEADSDIEVRKHTAQLLLDLVSSCRTDRCLDVIGLLHKIIKRLFSTGSASTSPSPQGQGHVHYVGKSHDQRIDDIYVSVAGLVTIFKAKLYQLPCNHAQRIFEILVEHLETHYSNDFMLKTAPHIRKSILEVLLDLRADRLCRLGLVEKGRSNYSPYVLCAYRPELCDDVSDSPVDSPQMACGSPVEGAARITIINYAQAFRAIKTCLEKEMDWQVLQLILDKLPQVLQNKTLILSAEVEDMDRFTARLCAMVNNSNLRLPDKLTKKPEGMSRSEFHSHVFPVLTCLVSYHTHLDKNRQTELVRCLEFGLVSKSARECVRALTVCSLEMHDVMIRQLPHVLLRLSQISATVAMAIPLMEFLSGLIRLPHLYANFIEDQYLSFFAIALPYTNPFKYSHYTVSLAYHVIAMWFLKCKVPFRKKFVKFIIKGLHANVLRPIDENVAQTQRLRENEDSSERGRVRSLNDESLRTKAQAAVAVKKAELAKPDDKVMQFHKELMETCIDMMSRFAFSTCASMPKRSNVAEFLLEGGQVQSWLLGSKIVTITTSGGARVGSTGLCDKCLQFARRASEKAQNPVPVEGAAVGRKRHRSDAVRSRSETIAIKPTSQDDMLLHQRGTVLREEQSDSVLLTQSATGTFGGLSSTPRSLEDSSSSHDQSLGVASKEHKLQLVDNVLMSLTAKPTDKSVFSPQQVHCNCWCTLWAEIHIRRPTGNLSWMLRLQNEQDLAEAFPEIMADISNLFMTSPEDDILEYRERRKIDSMTLGESEYDTLLEEHFMSDDTSLDGDHPFTKHRNNSGEQVRKKKLSTQVEEEEIDGVLAQVEAGLRKSSSSPDLTASQQEQLIRGRAQSDLQEVYTRSLEIQKQVPTSPRRVFRRQISAPPSPEKWSDGERSTSESSNPEDEIDGRLSSLSVRGHAKLSRRISAPPTTRPHSLDASGFDLTSAGWSAAGALKEAQAHGGVSPSFLFLQLYHSHLLGVKHEHRPTLLQNNDVMKRSVKMLDLIYPYETYKIGVLYVGQGQSQDETAILSNCYGSCRYMEFLQGLGHLVQLTDTRPEETFIGGLDVHGNDGKFAYAWHDDFMQTIYHVATLMPQKESDPKCNQKKLHIGNDYVTIVYNESGEEYKIGTIKGQFNYVNIVITPLDHGSNAVTVQTRDDISDIIGHTDTKVISDAYLAALVRQMGVHANLASEILKRQQTNPGDPYASNWLERLRQIKRIKTKVENEVKSNQQQQQQQVQTPILEDFTDFV